MSRFIQKIKKDKFSTSVAILSAGVGNRIKSYEPRSLLKIGGETLLDHQIKLVNNAFEDPEIIVALGYAANKVIKKTKSNLRVVENQLYSSTGSLESLRLTVNNCTGDGILFFHGDLYFNPKLTDYKSKGRNFEELSSYFKSFDIVKQIENYKEVQKSSKFKRLKAANDFFMNMNYNNNQTHYTYYGRNKTKVLIYYILDYFRDRKRKSFIDKNLVKDSKFNESFVYFPLHMEMERTTLIGAPYFINQIDIIRSVAKSLPINFKLYVKEHPIQILRGWRSKEEYQEIMDIPNVRLLHPDFSNDILYNNCSLVFTIAGTAGFEAACYGKPSIIMVKLNYLDLPSVTLLNNFNELHDLIKNKLKEKVSANDVSEFLNLFKTNASNFDWGGFTQKLSEEFFKNKTRDAQISNKKMESFLKENDQILEDFAEEHFKKIQLFEQEESSK